MSDDKKISKEIEELLSDLRYLARTHVNDLFQIENIRHDLEYNKSIYKITHYEDILERIKTLKFNLNRAENDFSMKSRRQKIKRAKNQIFDLALSHSDENLSFIVEDEMRRIMEVCDFLENRQKEN